LPQGIQVLDAGGATMASGAWTWSLGTLNAGDVGERRMTVQAAALPVVGPPFGDSLVPVARAVVTSGTTSSSAVAVTQVKTASPLALVMTATPDPVGLGDLIIYSLTVTNTGAVDAAGVALRMPVPELLYSTSGCREISDGGVFPAGCAAG